MEIIRAQAAAYPEMQAQDAVKLLYQSEFGAGHLVSASGLADLAFEIAQLPEGYRQRTEYIGGGFARLYLSRQTALTMSTLQNMFAATNSLGSQENFEAKLAALEVFCAAQSDSLPPGLAPEPVSAFLQDYRSAGHPIQRHSQRYRKLYQPHYRVVDARYARFLPLFERIDTMTCHGGRLALAIDGWCGSGKSTLAALITDVYSCNLFHMDNFFLPSDMRTAERLSQPGGNIHHERFASQVLAPLASGRGFSYEVYDCQTETLTPAAVVPKALTVVEGSYSLHPAFGDAYGLRIFLRTTPERQQTRLAARSRAANPDQPDALLERFNREWIPMEQAYFDAYGLEADCDLCFET